jgi:hypothetical protein
VKVGFEWMTTLARGLGIFDGAMEHERGRVGKHGIGMTGGEL